MPKSAPLKDGDKLYEESNSLTITHSSATASAGDGNEKQHTMQIKYIPKLDNNYGTIAGREVAFAILTPDAPKGKLYVVIAVHGIGERSGGTQEHLENLVLGQKQPDGSRKWPFVTDDMKKAVDQYNLLMIIPTYETNAFFEPAKVNYVFDYVKANYQVYEKFMLTGFSYGGGAVVKYITSNLTNAQKVAYAVPCAAVNSLGDATIPGKANVPVHAFSNDNDPTVNVSNTKTIITAINASNPLLKALQTIFRTNGHGGNNEAWSLTPPKAPGGQGFVDAAENIYQVFQDNIANGPRQMKSGTVIQPPNPPGPVDPTPVSPTPVTSYTIDASGVHLKGDQSKGYASGMDGKWEFVSGPVGATNANVFPGGSTYINADGKLPVNGTYVFRFILKGATPVLVTVVHGAAAKTLTGFDSTTDLVTYSDGSTEKGTAIYSGGKWVVKNSAGQPVA